MKYFLSIILISYTCLFLSTCKHEKAKVNTSVNTLSIIYTNDEHGWMEPTENYAGAAGITGRWKARDAYGTSDDFLVLSGGDLWTGPAISTWFEGESMTEVMNQMGYDAAAIGNHEFDFTVDVLNIRLQQMNFPFLAANIYEKGTETVPSFAKPYIIKEVAGVKVGIIGLASQSTPHTSFPANVAAYEFTDYADAIEKYAPQVQNEGADFIIIVGHICIDEMQSLIPVAKKYNIPFIGGGHCHQSVLLESEGVVLAQTNGELREYIKIKLSYDEIKNNTSIVSKEKIANTGTEVDNDVENTVTFWQTKVNEALAENIGYCSSPIEQSAVAMGNLVCDSWFYTFPDADISITNSGGIRQDIEAGSITLETIVGLLPFNNSIIKLKLSGTELLDCIDGFLLGGMTTIGGNFLTDGSPIEADKEYTVLTTDYLYSISENNFSKYDTAPENTSVNYRQPLIDWIRSLNTDNLNPLNNYLDNVARR
ncbi:MAG: bifunctional UDP-sugar hydrolase/5'-nucleotidase [Bacteroidales bacterium]|nr:bifunctional UDP-sugar hydrolase/5'-nucleotidase [Bacteroidales bacterium]